MKKILILLTILGLVNICSAQGFTTTPLQIDNELILNYYDIKDLPNNNSYISFTRTDPFVDYKKLVLDRNSTHQFWGSLPPVTDSLLSECVKFTMLSFNYELYTNNSRHGAEIWDGISKGSKQTFAGIYYRNFGDSTRLYVLTTFPWKLKSKTNISKLIGDRIIFMMKKHLEQKAGRR